MATKRERELERMLKEALARGDRLERANARLEKKLDEMMERQEQLQTEIRRRGSSSGVAGGGGLGEGGATWLVGPLGSMTRA